MSSKDDHDRKHFALRKCSFLFSIEARHFIDLDPFKESFRRYYQSSTIARIENNNKNMNAARSVRVGPFVRRVSSSLTRVEIARSDSHESSQTARLLSIFQRHEDQSIIWSVDNTDFFYFVSFHFVLDRKMKSLWLQTLSWFTYNVVIRCCSLQNCKYDVFFFFVKQRRFDL